MSTNYPLWSAHQVIYEDSDEGFSMLWGKWQQQTQKCLGIRYPYFPYKEIEGKQIPTYLVVPTIFTQSVFEKILSRAILDDHSQDIIDKIKAAMTEWESYAQKTP